MATEQTQNTEANEVPEKEVDVSNGPEYRICPCCKKPTLPRTPEINKDVMDHFMVCLMTGVPFSNTYNLYDGRVSVCIEQMTSKETDLVVSASNVLTPIISSSRFKKAEISPEGTRSILRLMCSVKSISFTIGSESRIYYPKEHVFTACKDINKFSERIADADWTDDDIAEMKKICDKLANPAIMSGVNIKQILAIVETHSRLYDILMDAGFDENFWAGIKLD